MRQIDQALLDKLNSKEQTKFNDANPKMSIQVSRARSSVMDKDYWTVETIRTKEGIGDISVAGRRLSIYGRLDRLYEIHVDNGIVKTTIREYPDYQKVGWQHQFDLGLGSAVAISFDGEWDLYRRRWRMKTTEKPWIFWVDDSNILWAQLWDDGTSMIQLSSGVSKVKAMRGWKNFNIAVNDQGIVASYIKSDGLVYYRNYCKQADGSTIWEVERLLTQFTGVAANLNMFLTNDYRMGFVIENLNHDVSWYVTGRNWAGMALGAEVISASLKVDVNLIPVNYIDSFCADLITCSVDADLMMLYAGENAFVDIANQDNGSGNYGINVSFSFQQDMHAPNIVDFELIDGSEVRFDCTQVTVIDATHFVGRFVDFNNAVGTCTLRFKALYGTSDAGYVFEVFEGQFVPVGLVPVLTGPPTVSEVWNE